MRQPYLLSTVEAPHPRRDHAVARLGLWLAAAPPLCARARDDVTGQSHGPRARAVARRTRALPPSRDFVPTTFSMYPTLLRNFLRRISEGNSFYSTLAGFFSINFQTDRDVIVF